MIFRYPGGKDKLIPTLAPFLDRVLTGAKCFADVFTGGGSILVHVAKNYPKISLHANDADDHVAAFWRVVASHRVHELCDRLQVKPTVDLFYEIQGRRPTSEIEKAFRVVFLNRCSFSGVWWGNPLGGKLQSSSSRIFARWNGTKLIESIQEAHRLLKGRLVVTSVDGAEYVRRHPEAPKFLDPPYFQRGAGLYRLTMTLGAHLRLAEALRRASRWVLTYDDAPAVRELYRWADIHKIERLYHFNQARRTGVPAAELVIVPGRD